MRDLLENANSCSSLLTTVDLLVRLSEDPVTSLPVCNAFTACLFLKVLVFFENRAVIASRQFACQAFIFSIHQTGTSTFPSRYVMSAMTFGSSPFPAFSSKEAALRLVSTKRSAASGATMQSSWRNFRCKARARQPTTPPPPQLQTG